MIWILWILFVAEVALAVIHLIRLSQDEGIAETIWDAVAIVLWLVALMLVVRALAEHYGG